MRGTFQINKLQIESMRQYSEFDFTNLMISRMLRVNPLDNTIKWMAKRERTIDNCVEYYFETLYDLTDKGNQLNLAMMKEQGWELADWVLKAINQL